MLADGGDSTADIDALRHQAGVLGPVASAQTVWRTLEEVSAFPGEEDRCGPGSGLPPGLVAVRWGCPG